MKLLSFSRKAIALAVEYGWAKQESVKHWEVCNDLKKGLDLTTIQERHHLTYDSVYKIRKEKCPEC